MLLAKSTSSDHYDRRKGEIIKMGYLKKLKTMKKKFFILRAESSEASARLEYYDNEKKWKNQQPPKRTITLKTCFNINRRRDTKHKHVIGLYQKLDCFCIVLDTEEELESWLKSLLELQCGEDVVDGEPPKPIFEHVWRVTLQEKGLGDTKNLVGPYHVCLTDQTLSLVKITDDDEQKSDSLDFPLMYVRSCGVTGNFLYIEVGRQTVTGAGALWMLTEDATIAKNMNQVIFSAFSLQQNSKEGEPHRKRSSSATESSKPALSIQRRQTHVGSKSLTAGYSEDGGGNSQHTTKPQSTALAETEQEHMQAVPVSSSLALPLHSRHVAARPPSQRRHSVSAVSSSSSTATLRSIPAPPHQQLFLLHSDTMVTDGSTVVSHQRTKSCPVSDTSSTPSTLQTVSYRRNSNPSSCPIHTDRSVPNIDTNINCNNNNNAHVDNRRSSFGGKRTLSAARSMTGPRERSDSMPSRSRTTSEGGHHTSASSVLPHSTRLPHNASQYSFTRLPSLMYGRGVSHSPPVGSGPCSTDSAGSSLSIDDGEMDLSATSPRTGYGHSSTPDEPAIMEENFDEYGNWNTSTVEEEKDQPGDYVPMNLSVSSHLIPTTIMHRKTSEPLGVINNDYVAMNQQHHHLHHRKISEPAYIKSNSPLQSYGSSPLDTSNYLPMSPVGQVDNSKRMVNHSRGSSLTEETPDGYVPMAPNHTDDGYVDMDPVTNHRTGGDDYQNSDMSPGSSCSITSGTPSTDIRFSEYHLEKVSSYFTPSEEDEDRPARAYSFGSRPDNLKKKVKSETNDTCRSRAFSVGSKVGKWGPRNLIHEAQRITNRSQAQPGPKSSSAPILSSSWSGTTYRTPNSDLMEIDFTKNKKNPRSKVTTVLESSSQLNLDQKVVTSSSDSGYMDMSSKSPSGVFPISKLDNELCATSPPRVVSASPRSHGYGRSPPKSGSYESTRSKPLTISSLFSPPSSSSTYMDMSRCDTKTRVSKPTIISSSTLKTIGEKGDIKPQKFPTTSSANLNISALPNKLYTPKTNTSAGNDDQSYMDMTPKSNKKIVKAKSDKDMMRLSKSGTESTVGKESYLMEMSWSASNTASKSTRKTSLSTSSQVKQTQDDYMQMSFGGGGPTCQSQPIAIRGQCQKELLKSSSSVSPAGKVSSTTPPKVPPNYLSLDNGCSPSSSPFSSIKRNQKRRNSRKKMERRKSKENVTTPTGSNSAIFPLCLNSPGSPLKTFSPKPDDNYINDSSTPTNSSLRNSPSVETDSPLDEVTSTPAGIDINRPYCGREHDYMEIDAVPLSRVLRISSKDNSSSGEDYGEYAVMRSVQSSKDKTCPILEISSNTLTVPEQCVTASSNTNVAQNITTTSTTTNQRVTSPTQTTARRTSSPINTAKKQTYSSSSKLPASTTTTPAPASDCSNSGVSRQLSTSSSTSSSSDRERKASSPHTGVCRQVSSSSSSSTEVASVKEDSCIIVNNSSERSITYASLDLAPSGSECEDASIARSPRTLRTESSGSSPSPNPCETFTYAEIDFVKSESLRSYKTNNKKIRH